MHMYETAATDGAEREESGPSICRFAADCKPAGRSEVLNCFLNLSGQRITWTHQQVDLIFMALLRLGCWFSWFRSWHQFQCFFLQRRVVPTFKTVFFTNFLNSEPCKRRKGWTNLNFFFTELTHASQVFLFECDNLSECQSGLWYHMSVL